MGNLFGGGQTIATTDPRIGSMQIQQSSYGTPIPLLYGKTRIAGNLIDYLDFVATPHTSTQSSGGKGGGVTTSNTTYTYSATVALGLCHGGASGEVSIGAVWQDKNKFATLASVTGNASSPVNSAIGGGMTAMISALVAQLLTAAGGWTIFDGGASQAAWGFMSTYHADHALNYRGLAYLASANHQLSGIASLGNYSFEVRGLCRYSSSIEDAAPKDVLIDFMTHPIHGAGLPAAEFGDLSLFHNWCIANSLFISPAFIAQKSAADHWTNIMDALACAPVYSDGLLKVIPYGEEAVTGNGVTYMPNVTPVYHLTDDDYLDKEQPVIVRRKAQVDAFNEIQAEYNSRANDYNLTTVTVKDQACIEQYGLRPAQTAKWDFIAAPAVAARCAQMKLQRGIYVRNEYEFRLGWNYARLEPMDIVALNESQLGLIEYPVRIISTDEAEDGEITVLAEELVYGVSASAMLGNGQLTTGGMPNASAAPGHVTAPLMIEPPLALTNGINELWCAVAGGVNWGGCNIWLSLDGSSYQKTGQIVGGARYGTLNTAIAAPTANPDVTNTVIADLLTTDQMHGGSQFDVDAYITLCYLGGELFAYRDAALTAAQRYSLSYLRRGLYGTTPASHSVGAAFARLDQAIYKQSLAANLVGKTLYFKFTSFNLWGQAEENLADVNTYTHIVTGGLPSGPANLGLQLPFTGLNFTAQWTAVAGAAFYDVDVWAGGVLRHVITTTATQFSYSLADAITDGYVGRDFELKVAASANGQLSGYSQIAFSNPIPSAVMGLGAVATVGDITLGWTAHTDTDLKDYQAHISTTSGFTPGAGTLAYTGTANNCVIAGLTSGVTYYLRVCARDQWGGTTWNYSTEFTKSTL
jgi:hypothetical protein